MKFTILYSCLTSRLQLNKADYFDPIGCSMPLYTERANTHLIVASDFTVFHERSQL